MRGKMLVAGLLLGVAAVVMPAAPAAAVIGGSLGDRDYYSYYVDVYVNGGSCGGSLIGGDWVLTAAHCIIGDASTVTVGFADGSQTGTSLVIKHPLYDGSADGGHDLALILLPTGKAKPFKKIQVGSPWDAGATAAGTPATLMGAGDTTYFGNPDGFRTSPTTLLSDSAMDDIYNPWYWSDDWIENLMIGAGSVGHNVCFGDSGSPLVVTRGGTPVEVGVTSFGYPLDCDHPSAFAELTGPQLDWVASLVPQVATGWGPCTLPGGGTGLTSVTYGSGPATLPTDGPNRYGISCLPTPPGQRPATVFTNLNSGLLWESTVDGTVRMVANGLGVAPGTTPAVAQLANGRVIAFQAAGSGTLWVVDTNNVGHDTGIQLAAGSSPTVAAHPLGGWEVVFHRKSDNALWALGPQYNSWPVGGLGIAPGTSPAVVALAPGGYEIVFSANGSGNLWTVGPDNNGHDTGAKISAGTSPAIAASPTGGWQAAYRRDDGALWTLNNAGQAWYSGLGIAPGTSPAIAALTEGGYEMAFSANGTGRLWTVTGGVGHETVWEPAAGTSPAIAPLITVGVAVLFTYTNNEVFRLRDDDTLDYATNAVPSQSGPGVSTWRPAGPITIIVPNVVSTKKDDAVRAMTAAGLTFAGSSTANNCVDVAGSVLTQNPSPGAHVLPLGSPFTLTVASGTDAKGKPCVIK